MPPHADASRSGRWHAGWGAALLFIGVWVAYLPALHGGPVWDDDYMLTANPVMTDPHGLWRALFDLRAVQVFYPLTMATLWTESRFFGLQNLTGYHVVNVLLHAVNSTLLWRLLKRLEVRGAFFAAAVFALHPLQVETVAWVTELKNTLSGLLFLLAGWSWLRSQGVLGRPRLRWPWYGASVVLFAGALAAKSAVAPLPALLLVVVWWKTGRLPGRAVLAAMPLLALAAASGVLTQWVETHVTGTWNPAWGLTVGQKTIVAGEVFWFYPGKLVWPRPISFMYPRWRPDPAQPVQFIGAAAAVALGVVLWSMRRLLGRGPLAAVVGYAVMIAPASGFFHVLFQRYSFVADHFQYLACIGPIALLGNAGVRLCAGFGRAAPHVAYAATAVALLGLGLTTHHDAARFRSDQSIWMNVLAVDPDSPAGNLNYGASLVDQKQFAAAEPYLRRSVEDPLTAARGWSNLGRIAEAQQQYAQAMICYRRGVELDPRDASLTYQLGTMLMVYDQFDAAADEYRVALQSKPDWAEAHDNLGICLLHLHRPDLAVIEFNAALRLRPDSARTRRHLGQALTTRPTGP